MEDQAGTKGPADPDPHRGKGYRPSPERVADAICEDLLAIHRDSYGGSAQGASATFVGDTLVVLLDAIELLPGEELLIANDRADAVAMLRSEYQRAIEPAFRAAVERATGRSVLSFTGHVQVEQEPRFAVEIFSLEPA